MTGTGTWRDFEPVRMASDNHCYCCGGCCSVLAPNNADIHERHYRVNSVTAGRPLRETVDRLNREFNHIARLCT